MIPLPERAWRWWNALFTGIPFGIFKLEAGCYLCLYHPAQTLAGSALALLGALDILLNLLACFFPNPFPFCVLSGLGQILDTHSSPRRIRFCDLGLALDTLLAFSVVALMIWNGCLPTLVPTFGRSWDVAVVCNVLGVGLARVAEALGLGRATAERANSTR